MMKMNKLTQNRFAMGSLVAIAGEGLVAATHAGAIGAGLALIAGFGTYYLLEDDDMKRVHTVEVEEDSLLPTSKNGQSTWHRLLNGRTDLGTSRTCISPETVEREVALVKTLEGTADFALYSLPLGKTLNGKTLTRTPKQLKNILILGQMEGGKTNTAIHLIRHLVPVGARIAIIDKHAHSEEDSLTQKIACLEAAFDCPTGHDPDSSLAVVHHVRSVMDNRMEGAQCSYPLVLVCDEYSAIMRQKEDGGKWQACAMELAGLIEDTLTEGRKHKVFCICIGQISNVSRTGGSEIRELFATRIAHRMSVKQAQLFGFTDEARQIQSLDKGHVCIQTEGLDSTFLKVPYVRDEELAASARRIPLRRVPVEPITEDLDSYSESAAAAASAAAVSGMSKNSEILAAAAVVICLPDGWTEEEASWARWTYARTGSKEKTLASLGKKGANGRLRAELDQILQEEE